MSDDIVYPTGPAAVPPDLTRPTAAYKRHAYLAVAGLLIFVAAYFGLAGWFAWTAYRLLSSISRAPDNWILLVAVGGGAAFLAVFMLKAVIPARRAKDEERDLEITAADHPRLFAFLHRLADEAGAPRPHRVFLSPRVNAAVFYELSVANLLLPSKKNLEIGLGLVNVLTLGEIKAVLAHELGHFAQRTMAVGRWVYTAQQIAGHIVVKRDQLDEALHALSRIDLRVAWIGWILRLIVWSIRSLVDTLFGWVVMAQRALSREMELQADLVAVSLTGSDALVHALHRLEAADDAMDRALAFTGGEVAADRAVADVFAIQTRMLEHKRAILDDPSYGQVPPLPADPAAHRVFEEQLGHPPRMWATHPPSELREANAKRVYVSAPLDDRSGWILFEDPEALRAKVSAALVAHVDKRLEPVPIAESLATVDKAFDRRYFDPAYRGVYLGRSAMRAAENIDALYAPTAAEGADAAALQALYPASLAADLAQVRELTVEKAALEALRKGVLEAPGRVVRFRGQDRKRKELPALIADVEHELAAARERVTDHDRRVRTTHLAAARALGGGWDAYLRGLAALVHYADHAEADLDDAVGHVDNMVAVVTADGKVTERELDRLVTAGTELYEALQRVYGHAGEVVIGEALAMTLEIESWGADLEEFQLDPPYPSNIGDWLGAAMTWVRAASSRLSRLHDAALEELLRAEAEVGRATHAATPLGDAPPPPKVPGRYQVLLPGRERPRQQRLGWWDRFQLADGFVPAAARTVVAAAIVGGVLWAGRMTGDATLYIYNGLGRPVAVHVDGTRVEVPAHGMRELEIGAGSHAILTQTTDGQVIEAFEASADNEFGRYVYNVAQASPLVTSTFARTASVAGAPSFTANRWFRTEADRVHGTLPSQVEGRGDSVSVLASLIDEPPWAAVQGFAAPEIEAMALAHARWEPATSPDLASWMQLVPEARIAPIILARVEDDPDDVLALRMQQDLGGAEVCARHTARAAERPEDARWQYLAARCVPDGPEQDAALAATAARFPDAPWSVYSLAVLDEYAGRWADAANRYQRAIALLPEMRENLAMRLARTRRASAAADDAVIADLAPYAPVVTAVLALERATPPPEPWMTPWWHLGFGRLEQADHSADAGNVHLQVLLAASDGASVEIVNRVMGLSPASLDPFDALLGYALAVRTGRDGEPYLARTSELGPYADRARAFLVGLRGHHDVGSLARLEAALGPLPIEVRARLLAAAAVLVGENCPPAWRQLARRALFRTERPYLAAT